MSLPPSASVVTLGVQADTSARPIPRMTVAGLPAPSLVFSKDGSAKAGPSRLPTANGHKKSESAVTNPSEQTARTGVAGPIPELDNRPYERPLSKREKANVSILGATTPVRKSIDNHSNPRRLLLLSFGLPCHPLGPICSRR